MNTRQRPNEPRTSTTTAGGAGPSDSALSPLREQARTALSVADDAIDRALASDTRQYLENRLQRGGQ
jgi:hypothetical protein